MALRFVIFRQRRGDEEPDFLRVFSNNEIGASSERGGYGDHGRPRAGAMGVASGNAKTGSPLQVGANLDFSPSIRCRAPLAKDVGRFFLRTGTETTEGLVSPRPYVSK